MKTFVIGDIHGRCAQLQSLLDMLPREATDTLVFLGDLIDRGPDVPGCVEHVIELCRRDPKNVICLRGNHEQMLIDFINYENSLWLESVTGGGQTFAQYTGTPLRVETGSDLVSARNLLIEKFPTKQIEFFKALPLYYEDDHALYVHAGLEDGKHPRDSSTKRAALDSGSGFLSELSRQAVRVWSHADSVLAAARATRSSWNLPVPQCDWDRHRLQPALASDVSVAAGLHALPGVRRR